jgi:hypothetical protein
VLCWAFLNSCVGADDLRLRLAAAELQDFVPTRECRAHYGPPNFG